MFRDFYVWLFATALTEIIMKNIVNLPNIGNNRWIILGDLNDYHALIKVYRQVEVTQIDIIISVNLFKMITL